MHVLTLKCASLPPPLQRSKVQARFIYTSSPLTARPQPGGPSPGINPTMHRAEVVGFAAALHCTLCGRALGAEPGVRHFGSLMIGHPGPGADQWRVISHHGVALTPPNEKVVGVQSCSVHARRPGSFQHGHGRLSVFFCLVLR